MKLRTKVLIVILPVWIASLVLFNIFGNYYLNKDVELRLNKELRNVAIFASDSVSSTVTDAIGQLKVLGGFNIFNQYVDLRSYQLHSEEELKRTEIQKIFNKLLENKREYLSLQYVDPNGKQVVAAVSPYHEVRKDAQKQSSNLIKIKYDHNTEISEAYYNPEFNEQTIYIAYQLTGQGFNAGKVVLGISLNKLLETFSKVRLLKDADVQIYSERFGKIFPVVAQKNQAGVPSANYIESEKMDIPIIRWKLSLLISRSDAFSFLSEFRSTNYILVLVFVLSIFVLTYFLSRNISKPAESLILHIRDMEENRNPVEGKFGVTLRGYGEEFEAIANALDKMVEEINRNNKKIRDIAVLESIANISAQVAHDIRSPLVALDVALKNAATLPEAQRVMARHAVNRIRDIANNLVEKHKPPISLPYPKNEVASQGELIEPHLISSLIEPVVAEKRLQFESNSKVVIDFDMSATSYGLFAGIQPVEFRRMVSNLLNNSVEAIIEEGSVTVSLTCENGRVLFSVSDTGKGISAEILGKLGHKGETYGKPGGSGLGLYHAKTMAESWGGKLEIYSELGKGATVSVTLPAAEAPSWFVSRLELSVGRTAVVLDDDETIHQVWKGRFESRPPDIGHTASVGNAVL